MGPDPTPGQSSNERVLRLARPSIVVLCGPAGCGKSTFAANHFRPTQIISSDHCRALVCDDELDQRFQSHTFALLHFIVEERLSLNRLCVVDSTALTQSARRALVESAKKYRVPCVVLSFEIPLEACVARDQARGAQPSGRAVGRAIIERHYKMFEVAKSAILHEGFDRVESLRDEDCNKVRFEIVFRPTPRAVSAQSRRIPLQGQPASYPKLSAETAKPPAGQPSSGQTDGTSSGTSKGSNLSRSSNLPAGGSKEDA